MSHIATLLDIQKQSRDCENVDDLAFIIVNHVKKIVPYDQAIFWIYHNKQVNLINVSGGQELEKLSPYAIWLSQFIQKKIEKNPSASVMAFNKNDFDDHEWIQNHHALIPFLTNNNEYIGGIWIDRDRELSKVDQDILIELADYMSHCLQFLNLRKKTSFLQFLSRSKATKWILCAFFIVMLLPVRLTMTAPAEIVPKNPIVITAPFDGIIDYIHVKPGQDIKPGDQLVMMDQTILQTQYEDAVQALKTANTALSQAGLESLRIADKKTDLQALKFDIETKKIELDHITRQIEKSQIRSTGHGVAMFSDANEFKGKPIAAGEKIMMVSNHNHYDLLIRVPSKTMLNISKDHQVSFFMNPHPFTNYNADIQSIGYQATRDEDGLLTYKIRANIQGDDVFRIGWKGTAKIKTEWSVLGYALLRRPMIAFRNLLGL